MDYLQLKEEMVGPEVQVSSIIRDRFKSELGRQKWVASATGRPSAAPVKRTSFVDKQAIRNSLSTISIIRISMDSKRRIYVLEGKSE